MKVYSKYLLSLLLAVSVTGLAGCKDQASNTNTKKTAENKVEQKAENKAENKAQDQKTGTADPNDEKAVQELIMKDTNIVQISNISRRTNPTFPDMGPFFVIRGMDYRGQVHEIWIKDLKIYQMTPQKTNQ